MKRLITAETIVAENAAGRTRLVAPARDCIVTPEAWTRAAALGVTIEQTVPAAPLPPADLSGSCERVTDASGVTLVRGQSVQLGRFSGAGPDKQIGLLDLITSKQGSPMTAGIMSWAAADSFAWSLDYDEVDYVLEGILQVKIDGRTVEGRPGDVIYIPQRQQDRLCDPKPHPRVLRDLPGGLGCGRSHGGSAAPAKIVLVKSERSAYAAALLKDVCR
jgi:mannose-6-phosphate isomerase-like protein (cupin superfamily)